MELEFIPKSEFDRIAGSIEQKEAKLSIIADMCRLNALFEVKMAGSGHLGSSFSAMDIVVFLYHDYLNIRAVGPDDPDRDIYFSSKGHDVPGLYAVLFSLGIIDEDKLCSLRRMGGLDGHPDVAIPGIEANSGSLGMGISKGKGMAFAKAYRCRGGKVIVLTGDGEFQEGQNFEALQSAGQQKRNEMIVVMDHNKVQSDRLVRDIVDLGDLERKISSFGWHVQRCNGHDFLEIEAAFKELEGIPDMPKFLICDTIKGKGVSFMEHPVDLERNGGHYRWHSGAPADEPYTEASREIRERIEARLGTLGVRGPGLETREIDKASSLRSTAEYVSSAYGKALVDFAAQNDNFIVLDADLSSDCKLRDFEHLYPERFIECGIAEQDMVSMAGGLALQGLLPVVNTFASFLASRANEQIYNALSENTKVVFACHYAGLIPAGPGKSHQSLRDISLFGALHNCTILQPVNSEEMRAVVDYAINRAWESCMIRIPIGPSPRTVSLPDGYTLAPGRGAALTGGRKTVLMAYGPVMMNEALVAHAILQERKIPLKVVSMPWLNRFDQKWIEEELSGCEALFILEDHSVFGGLGDNIIGFLVEHGLAGTMRIRKLGISELPACGTPAEVLRFHRLDGQSLSERITAEIGPSC